VFEHVPDIDDEAASFIESVRPDEVSHRGLPEFNWIVRYPWVLETPVADNLSRRYHFTSVARRFTTFFVKVRNSDGGIVGCLLLRIHNNRLVVPYAFLEPECAEAVLFHLLSIAVHGHVSRIHLYGLPLMAALRSGRFPRLRLSLTNRRSIISRKFTRDEFAGRTFHLGDGDGAFA
jgi:hypothetical protein